MNGIPNGFGPSGIETKLLTHRYLEQKSYYVTSLPLDQMSLLPRARPRAHLGPTQPIIGKFFYCAASAGMQK